MNDDQRARFEGAIAALIHDYNISVVTVVAFYDSGGKAFGCAAFRLAAPVIDPQLEMISHIAHAGAMSAMGGIPGSEISPLRSHSISIVSAKKDANGGGMPF
jgi:hypothetical protein